MQSSEFDDLVTQTKGVSNSNKRQKLEESSKNKDLITIIPPKKDDITAVETIPKGRMGPKSLVD